MSIVWDETATLAASRYLADDPEGLNRLFDAVDGLVDDPRPDGSTEFGSPLLRRLRAGRYRVLYRISADEVRVIHVGRTS